MSGQITDVGGRHRLVAWSLSVGVERREAGWILDHLGSPVGGLAGPGSFDDRFRRLVERRASGEPLQYVLGRWAFRSLELDVDPRVLIPRPETEQVVEVALAELRAGLADPARTAGPALCADLGTGSGAIALAIATEAPAHLGGTDVWATDASAPALEVARCNLARYAAEVAGAGARVHLASGSWFNALPRSVAGRVDLVVANPPYVADSEVDDLDPVVRDWEPRTALVAADGRTGVGGMADVEAVVTQAPSWLAAGGLLVVEIAPHQAAAALEVAGQAGFLHARVDPDLSGRARMLVARV
jgi:release factor glutamine methyltransferase